MIRVKEKIYNYNYGDRVLLGEFFINIKTNKTAVLEDGRTVIIDPIDKKWYVRG